MTADKYGMALARWDYIAYIKRAQYLQDRMQMMQWYADCLEEIADQSIIQFKKVKW